MAGERQRINKGFKAIRERASRIILGTEPGWRDLQRHQDNISDQMKNRVYICINGILTKPSDMSNWTKRASAWIEDNTHFNADRYEYFSGTLTRRIFQNARVKNIEVMINRIKKDDVYLVGHSNGCDLIQRFIAKCKRRIEELHLIAAASECDFKKNGFNKALLTQKVGKIFVYFSHEDKVLEKAKSVYPYLSWMGLGYGYLGLDGAKNVDPSISDRVIAVERKLNHSSWFSPSNFEKTMRSIVGASND